MGAEPINLTIPRWILRPHTLLAGVVVACLLAALAGMGVKLSLSASPALAADRGDLRRLSSLTPQNVRPIAPQTAKTLNEQQPLAGTANPAASPFAATFNASADRLRSLDCLTSAIYYEAAMEPTAGQKAVAQVVLNRVRHVAYPDSVCGVVYEGSTRRTGCQFSFTCDGSLARTPSVAGWARARAVAEAALAGEVYAPVGYSTHYHANYVVPYWSPSLLKTATIGAHIFYRSPGPAGRMSAFTSRYAGVEPSVAQRQAQEQAQAQAEVLEPEQELVEEVKFASTGAIAPPVADVPLERAAELDKFGLLEFRKKSAAPAVQAEAAPSPDHSLQSALALAQQSGKSPKL